MLRGFMVISPAAGVSFALLFLVVGFAAPEFARLLWPLPVWQYAVIGSLAGLGFMAGELPNSFVKRRLGIPPGGTAREHFPARRSVSRRSAGFHSRNDGRVESGCAGASLDLGLCHRHRYRPPLDLQCRLVRVWREGADGMSAVPTSIERDTFVTWLEDAGNPAEVGNKAWNLGRMQRLGVCVPRGFVITASAFRQFIAENCLHERLAAFLPKRFGKSFEHPEYPKKFWSRYSDARSLPPGRLIVRSSAIGEDGGKASFRRTTGFHCRCRNDSRHSARPCWMLVFLLE